MASCYQCNNTQVVEEFERCASCQKAHEVLASKLDARPKVIEKKVKEKLYPLKQMKGGVEVTTWIDENDAKNMGIKLPL